jgi:hypothetical protein
LKIRKFEHHHNNLPGDRIVFGNEQARPPVAAVKDADKKESLCRSEGEK